MKALTRVISVLAVAASFVAFATAKVNAVDMPVDMLVADPAPFPVPGNPGFPAPAPPVPGPVFPGPGSTGNVSGGTGNAVGRAPGGGTGSMSGSGIH